MPIHLEVLDAALVVANKDWTFLIADLVHQVPHLHPPTVRTHVASRCCVNAPANHQSRYRYFRAIDRGVYRIEPQFRRRAPRWAKRPSQDVILRTVDTGIDKTLIAESLRMSPTERLETMRRAALSLDELRKP